MKDFREGIWDSQGGGEAYSFRKEKDWLGKLSLGW